MSGRTGRNILWLTGSRIIALALMFVAYRFLFRYLGPFGSGQYQFVLSYVTIFGVIVDFGIQQYIIKRMSEQPHDMRRLFHHFFAIELVLAALVYVAAIGTAWLLGYDQLVWRAIAVAGLGMALQGLTYPFLSVMSATGDLGRVAILNLLSTAVNVGMIFLTVAIGGNIVLLSSQMLLFGVIAILCYYRLVQRHIGDPRLWQGFWRIDGALVKQVLRAALPFALLVGFSTIYNRIDVVLITRILGFESAGFYTAAYKFFDLIAFFPAVITHSLYPVFAGLMASGDTDSVRQTLERYSRLTIFLGLPMGVGGSILAAPIISFLAGPEFLAAAPILRVLIWAPVVLCLYVVANALVVSQLTKYASWITGTNVLINIVGNLLLLPRFGIMGAAVMTVVSESLQGLFYFSFVRRRITSFRWLSLLWRPLIAAGIMGVFVYTYQSLPLFAIVPLGGLVYAVVLLLTGFFDRYDWLFLRRTLKLAPAPDSPQL